jgi:hypothetical protein
MTDEQRTKVIDVELTIGRLRELQSIYIGYFDGRSKFAELVGDAADLIEWFQSGKVPSRDIGCGTAVIEPRAET